jgi:hypothetical protein
MNDTINRLNQELSTLDGDREGIKDKLRTAWGLVFEASESIKTMVSRVETSTNYAIDKYGDISSFTHEDFSEFESCREYFEGYMQETHHVSIDWDNGALLQSLGTCIVINDDGDVYDQDGDKFFIKSGDYLDDNGDPDTEKRNELIEAYMESSGYFPGVFRVGKYGDVFSVNTKVYK